MTRQKNPFRTARIALGVCVGMALLAVAIAACGDSASEEPALQPTTPPVPNVAPASQPAAEPAAVAQPTAAPAEPPASMSESSSIAIVTPFAPTSNGAIETDDAGILVRAGALETLIKIDFDGEVKPFLAESWHLHDDAWEFHLREGVEFHNGASLDSGSVVAALTYLGGVANPPRGFTEDTLKSVIAEDAHTVVIESGSFDILLPTRLATASTGILSADAYANAGDAPPDPIGAGTGPFEIEGDISIESIHSYNTDRYWDGEANLESADTYFVSDGLVRAAMLETGEADIVNHLPVSQLPLYEGRSEFVIHKVQQPRTVTVYVNNRKGAFADVNVRKAAQHAIDKQAIVDSVLEGSGQPAVGPFAPDEAWVNADLQEYAYDPQAAKDLLAQAGYGEGEAQVSLWTYPSRAEFPAMAVAMHEMLSDAGFSAEIRLAPYGALVDDVFAGEFDMFLVSRGHLIDAYDPEGFLSADFSCGAIDVSNYANYCNPAVDELLEQARPMSDLEARYDIYRQIQQILHDEAASTFINYTEQIFAHSDRVINWQPHLLEYYMLTTDLDVTN